MTLSISPQQLLANDTDLEGDSLQIVGLGEAQNGTVVLNPDGSIIYSPNQNYSGSDTFTYTLRDSSGNESTGTVNVNIAGSADAPILTFENALGNEDSAIPLNISAALADIDGSENLSITISGVPSGATLSAGQDNGDGTYTLTAADLTGLTITPPADSSDDFSLAITATSTEGSDTASTVANVNVNVTGVADAPTVVVSDIAGDDSGVIPLNINAALNDTDGSESLSITVSGIPEGGSLSAGLDNGDGSYTLTADQLDGLTFTPPQTGSDQVYQINISATATESDGDTQSTASSFNINVNTADLAVEGTSKNDELYGQGGDDTIYGYEGNDKLFGGAGNDTIYGAEGNDNINGEAGDDILYGGAGIDNIQGGEGDDQLYGGDDRDTLRGDEGNDVIYGEGGRDNIWGGLGDDTIRGGADNDTARGEEGADTYIFGLGDGRDSFDGGTGDWTDAIKLEGANGVPNDAGADWTMQVDNGVNYTIDTENQTIEFDGSASGSITLDDNSVLAFSEIEKISWGS